MDCLPSAGAQVTPPPQPPELKRPKDWSKLGYARDSVKDRPVDYIMRVHCKNLTKERFVNEFERPGRYVAVRGSRRTAMGAFGRGQARCAPHGPWTFLPCRSRPSRRTSHSRRTRSPPHSCVIIRGLADKWTAQKDWTLQVREPMGIAPACAGAPRRGRRPKRFVGGGWRDVCVSGTGGVRKLPGARATQRAIVPCALLRTRNAPGARARVRRLQAQVR